jgi:endonuclease/exonuclease/phosphatase family metal-dependent hydrolase
MKSKLVHLVLWGSLITLFARFWPSDRWPLTAVLAYTPSFLILIAGLLNFTLIRTSTAGSFRIVRHLNWLLIVAAFLLLVADNRQFFRSTNPASSNHKLRILHWNVWGSRNGFRKISEEIRKHQPSIVFLSEPILHPFNEPYPDYQHTLGGTWYAWGKGNLLILSKYQFERKETLNDPVLKGMYVTVTANQTFHLLFVDLDPDLRNSRPEAFRILALQKWKPDVILGDLNTPAAAFSLKETFSRDYSDSYDLAGHGLSYTWPSWFPIARIDQIYVRKGLQISLYAAHSSRLSDHRMHWIEIDQHPAVDIHSKNK